jgi:hypothetical protein
MNRVIGYIIAIYILTVLYRKWIKPELLKWLEKHQKNPIINDKTQKDPHENTIPGDDIVDVDYKEID